jgi:lauroyl/myristoyl acyltransferase
MVARGRLRAQRRWAISQRRYLLHWIGEDDLGLSMDELLESYFAHRRLSKLQAFRCRHPSGWHPETGIEGHAFLQEAIGHGRGAILWVAPFVYGPLLTKMALHRAGYACSHLSRYSHGFSQSLLGARLLNPVRADVEKRFLKERVVIGPDGSVHAAVRRLTARLRANGVVSVSVGARGMKPVEVPFMKGSMLLAPGPIGLARQTGAPLLPVFTVRVRDGEYITRIGAPLVLSTELEREHVSLDVAARFARILEVEVRRHPDQFWWHYDILRMTQRRCASSASLLRDGP